MSIVEKRAKINGYLTTFVAVAGALAWCQPVVAGSDLWWHLASGREIWGQLAVHSTDPFSYTFAGREWLNHEWFWDVIYWAWYRLHPQAVAWFHLAVVAAFLTLAYRVALKESGSALAAGALIWLAAASSHWFIDIRPHVWTLLFTSLFLLTRDRPWAPWLWPPLIIAWANLHSGFVFGVGTIGLFVLVRTIERSLVERRLAIDRREWLSVILCLVAMLANPWGYRILAYPLAYLNADSPFRQIIEWQPPHFSLGLEDFHGRYTLVTALAALGAAYGLYRRRFYLVALASVTFAMAYTSRRFIPLLAITSAPLGALFLAAAIRELRLRVRPLGLPAAGAATLAAAALIAALQWQQVHLYPRLLERWTESTLYPADALRYIRAMGQPERVLNYYNWGGYIMLHNPGMLLFIDGRANTLYDDEIYLDYLAMLSGRPGILARARKYRADLALLPTRGGFARALARGPGAWRVVYTDAVARVLVPPDSPYLSRPLPKPSVVLAGSPDQLLAHASRAQRQGALDDAEALVERALAQNPLLLRAYARLVSIEVSRTDQVAIRAAIARALAETPRSIRYLKNVEGRAYEELGDLEAALEAYRQAVPAGPFSNPRGMQQFIRQLEERVQERSQSGNGGEDG